MKSQIKSNLDGRDVIPSQSKQKESETSMMIYDDIWGFTVIHKNNALA